MIIDSKFAYVKKKEVFEPLINTIPSGLNPIVFIEDTREMWTCGTYFSIGYPSIEISEVSGSVKVQIGNSFFLMSTAGESISIRKGDGNRIIISSNALSRVDTEPPLEWDAANRKLLHKTSGVVPGSYGQSTNLGNASIFVIPNIIVDATGHVTLAENHNIEIRDYVEQLAPSTLMGDRNILLSYNEASNTADTSQVRKANGLTFNDATQKMTIAGGMNSNGPVNVNHGDLSVLDGYIIGNLKGDVQGEATPKIHISLKPEYGGASTKLYGHVKLQDILNTKPDPSSDNENINDTNVVAAIAASPLMVWNAIQTAKDYADSILGSNNAMLYKGAVEAGTTSPGTFTPTADVGNTYVVTFGTGTYTDSVGYINGEPVEIGDLLICKESTPAATSSTWSQVRTKWTFVQTNTTGVVSGPSSSVVGQLAVFNSTTGKLIKGLRNGNIGQMLVIGNSGIPEWVNRPDRLNHALSFQVRGDEFISFDGYEPKRLNFIAGDNVFITPDEQGNLTFAADPGSDTVNTAGATNKIGTKLFLIGAESQTTSPQTYSNQYVYIGPDNKLYSNGKVVSTGDHVHNYAGATSSGGPALKVDLNPSGLLDATYGSYGGILQDSNKGPVSGSWSNRIKILHNNSTGYYTELAQNFTGTAGLWHRRNVAGTISEWTPVIDNANFHTYLDSTYVIRGNDPNVLTNYVRYSINTGLTMNWEWGNATPTHIWGAKASDSSKAYVFNGDNIRAFANAVNRAGDTMTGTLKVTEIQATNGNGLVMWNGTTYTYLGMQAGTTYIRSGETDLQHRYNGTDYKIWDARNLVGLRTEHSHNTINFIDSRETASTPQEHAAGVWLDFKANAKANLSDGGNYTGLLTVRKYGGTTDWTGGKSAQLGFTDNSNVWVRFGSGASWEAWKQLATTGWADSKFLPLAGGTVTGNIILKGSTNADMTNANIHPRLRFDNSDSSQTVSFIFTDYDSYRAPAGIKLVGNQGNEWFEAPKLIKTGSSDSYVLLGGGGHKALAQFVYAAGNLGVQESTGTSDNISRAQFWRDNNLGAYGVTLSHSDNAGYKTKIYHDYGSGGNLYMKACSNGTWGSVYTIWNSGNFDPNTKVNKAGDTMTGKLSWTMNGVTSSIGNENGSYTHHNTNASAGHWFNKNVYVSGNVYGGSSYNRILAFKDEINSQVGGSKSAQMNWASWGTGTYDGAIQIRETSLVGNGQSAWGYSPALTFHWGNRYAKRFGMRSDGQFAVDDVPISLSTHTHNYVKDISNGTNTTFAYSKAGMNYADFTWLAGWNGYELRAVNKSLFAQASHTHDYIPRVRIQNPSNSSTRVGVVPFNVLGLKTGYPMTADPEFASGNGLVSLYNNAGNGATVIERISDSSAANTTGYVMRIRNTGAASPGLGGFHSSINSRANAVFVQIFRAKIPTGHSVVQASNSMGSSYGDVWITDTAGTGKWEWYGRIIYCGESGSFSSGGHVYLNGNAGTSSSPLYWYISYCQVYDLTKGRYDGLRCRYADEVTNADTVDGQHASAFSYKSWWHWSGQSGQPTWLWGGNSENSYYVYNPSNFNVNSATYAHKVRGEYTGNSGQQNPNYFGVNWVGFRMMNTNVGGNSQYKDWIISDCYSGSDVGGAVAFGMNRQALGAYLMGSDSGRGSWSRKGTFWGDWNLTPGDYYDSKINRSANTVLAAPNGSSGSATFRKLVAADIPSLDYMSTKGGYSQPIVLAAGYVYRSSNSSSSWYFSGSKVSAISSVSCSVSGGVMTITFNPSSGHSIYCYAACANMATSGDMPSYTGNYSGRSGGAEWMGTYCSGGSSIWMRQMAQSNANNDSWHSDNMNKGDGPTRITLIVCGYHS